MSRPRIDFVAPPFRGHLHPILGLARALRETADVRVWSTASALAPIAASEVRGDALLRGREAAVAAVGTPAQLVRGNPWRLLQQFRAALTLLEAMAVELAAQWDRDRPDLVIVDSVLPSAGFVAQGRGLRWWTAAASPCAIEPRRGAPGYLGGWRHREDWPGRVRDRAGLSVVRSFKRVVFRLHRTRLRALGACGVYRADGSEAVYSPERILGLGMAELEFPRTWPAAFQFLGPVRFTPAETGATPRFEPDRRHVLVSFGTHLTTQKAAIAARLRAAAEQARRWVIHFSDGAPAAGDAAREEGGFFRRYNYVAYDRWLGRFDAVWHHGGAGVMYECIAAARPALVWPLDYDQFDHAVRLERAGIGRRFRPRAGCAEQIDAVLADEGMRAACRRMQTALERYRPGETLAALVAGALAMPARSAVPSCD